MKDNVDIGGSKIETKFPMTRSNLPFLLRFAAVIATTSNESNATFIIAADVNGDGLADVIMPGALLAGDFNGDGQTDLAVGLMLSQQACLLFNSGNRQLTRSFFVSGAAPAVVGVDSCIFAE
jgi:hypothetical protein